MLNKIRAMLASAGALVLATVLVTGLGVVAAPVAAAAEQGTASISGRVTGADPTMNVQADVHAYRWRPTGADPWIWVGAVGTEIDGWFQITNLVPGGRYRLEIHPDDSAYAPTYVGGTAQDDDSEALSLDEGENLLEPVPLTPAARLTGKVTSDGTTGIAGIYIEVLRHLGDGWYSDYETTTDHNGDYVVTGLTPEVEYRLLYHGTAQYAGTYSGGALSLERASGILVRAGDNPVPTVTLARGATITGKVTGPDGSGIGADVDAYAWDAANNSWEMNSSTISEDTGEYTLRGLLPGTIYRLKFSDEDGQYAHQYYLGASTLETAQDVIPSETGTVLDTVTLAERPSITGRVTSDGTTGIEGVTVTLYTRDDDGHWNPRTTLSEPDGRFEFTGLTPGATYRIGFDEAEVYAPTNYGADTFADAPYIPVAQEPITLPTVTLSVGAVITGTVTSDGTAGLAGIPVAAVGWDDAAGGWAHISETESDSSGRYTLPGLIPGASYKIRFFDPFGYLDEYVGADATRETAELFIAPWEVPPVTLRTMATPNLTLITSPASVTVGEAVTLSAAVAPEATGTVIFESDGTYLEEVPVINGTARLTTKLAAGEWRITAYYGGDSRYHRSKSTVTVTVRTATTPPTEPPVVTPPVVTPPVVTPPVVTPPVVTPPVVTPTAPTAVTLSRPTWSKSSQTYGHKSVARVTTTVTGATSGTVTFRSGGKVLGTAAIVAGKASLALPARQGIGAYVVTATVDATPTTAAATSPASAKFTVVKAKLAKKSKVTGKTFKKNAKPKITVTVGKLNTGAYATGKVKIHVGKKVVRTVTVTSKNKGKITVTLPKKYAKAIKVKATYVGNATTASDTSKVATVKVR